MSSTGVILPELASPAVLPEAVLFGFDNHAFPFYDGAQIHLIPGQQHGFVLRPGASGSHDEFVQFYGTVILIDDTFHMWYNGNYGSVKETVAFEREHCVICYATSKDGINWEKPNLGLVEFNGSKNNNIVALDAPHLWSTAAVLYDPEDPNPKRKFKLYYEANLPEHPSHALFSVAFSPDGLVWTNSPKNPYNFFLEAAGITKYRGMYYVYGQSRSTNSPIWHRQLCCYASADFENWSPCGAVGLDRSPNLSGSMTAANSNPLPLEEIHLGAGIWNRENVLVGLYGQWHGHSTNDRLWTSIDLGLAISHDAIHFHEPIPNFRILPCKEQHHRPIGVAPALEQGQGMFNFGDNTLFWYSLWRVGGQVEGSGVRLACWERDRLGMLKPFRPNRPMAISTSIQTVGKGVRLYLNASHLNPNSRLRISLLDRGFLPLPDFSGPNAAVFDSDGFKLSIRWGSKEVISQKEPFRIAIDFEGIRPEDALLHAVYIEGIST